MYVRKSAGKERDDAHLDLWRSCQSGRISGGCEWLNRLAALQQGRAPGDDGLLEKRRHHTDGAKNLRGLSRRESKVVKRTEPAMRTYVFSRTLKNIDEPG